MNSSKLLGKNFKISLDKSICFFLLLFLLKYLIFLNEIKIHVFMYWTTKCYFAAAIIFTFNDVLFVYNLWNEIEKRNNVIEKKIVPIHEI